MNAFSLMIFVLFIRHLESHVQIHVDVVCIYTMIFPHVLEKWEVPL